MSPCLGCGERPRLRQDERTKIKSKTLQWEFIVITGGQIRKARELLCWRAWKVARHAGVSTAIVRRLEMESRYSPSNQLHALAIRRTLEAAGVEFTDDEPPGVRLRPM